MHGRRAWEQGYKWDHGYIPSGTDMHMLMSVMKAYTHVVRMAHVLILWWKDSTVPVTLGSLDGL